jgi:anti-sigma factor (TIGR02949 family)
VDCKEALTIISAAVDGEVKGSKLKEFNEHISACVNCRAEYEAEKATKDLLRTKLKRVKAPQSLIDAIRKQTLEMPLPNVQQFSIANESNILIKHANSIACGHVIVAQHVPKWKLKLADLLFMEPSQSRVNSAFAFGLAASILAMLVFAGFMRNQQVSFMDGEVVPVEKASSNIVEMTVNAFESGNATADLKSIDPQVVSAYLTKVIGSQVVVPVADGFTLQAVHVTRFGTVNAGEIRYVHAKHPNTRFSVFVMNQADLNGTDYVPAKDGIYLLPDGQKLHQESYPIDQQVVIWKWSNSVYTAIASDENIDLLKMIKNIN